jgi:uncharacterized membrane protein
MNAPETSPAAPSSDQGWFCYGAIYYNPEDERSIVPRRSGLGSTVNFARPLAYVVLSVPFLVGAAIVLCVWLARG